MGENKRRMFLISQNIENRYRSKKLFNYIFLVSIVKSLAKHPMNALELFDSRFNVSTYHSIIDTISAFRKTPKCELSHFQHINYFTFDNDYTRIVLALRAENCDPVFLDILR